MQADWFFRAWKGDPEVRVELLPINPELPGPLKRLQQIKHVRTIATALAFWILLIPAIFRNRVIHVYCAGPPSFYLHPAPAVLLARLLGRKPILHFHDGRADGGLPHWPVVRAILRLSRVITPSPYLARVFAPFGISAQAIPNLIHTERFHYRRRTSLQPRFLHNRGLEELYNVPCVLRAFALVQQERPDAELQLAHDGPLRLKLEVMAAELGLRNITFVGAVSQAAMAKLYDWADIYWMSPNIDNMPGSVLECYASGLPVVSTGAGGVPDIVRDGETGLLVAINDHKAMAEAAQRLLRDPALAARLSDAGRRESTRYEWPEVRAQWLELYRKLAVERRTQQALSA